MKPGGLIRTPIEGEVLAPESASPVFLKPSPFVDTQRSKFYIPAGSSIAQVVDITCSDLPSAVWPYIEVLIGEDVIPRSLWRVVRPKDGAPITVRVMPAGKAGKNILRSVLMIAVVVGLTLLAPGIGTGLGITMTTAAGAVTAAGAAFTAAFVAVGSLVATLALNALIPPPGLAGASGNQKYTLENTSNQILAYQPIPRVFGKVRVYPCVVGRPYSEVVGKEQYLRMLLMVGYGPIGVTDLRIGNTPFLDYEGSSYEINEGGPAGWAGNDATDLYSRAIEEQDIDINMDDPGTSIIQTTSANTQEISVDITMPSGLTYFKPKGNGNSDSNISFYIQYRAVGTTAWQTPNWIDNPQGWLSGGGHMNVVDNTQTAIIASGRWAVPTGQYEVQIRRETPNEQNAAGNGTTVNEATWTALRSVTTDAPVIQEGVCLIAVRLKATKALNGVPATINCIASAYLPTTTDGTTWTYKQTRSPAWAFCDLYRRRGPDVLIADNRIDIPGIIAWDQACSALDQNGEPTFYFDGTISGGSIQNAASEVAAIGRAAPTFRDGKFSVVMDTVHTVPVQHITPRNSWNYSGSIVFVDQPHALRAQFLNEEKNYVQDELIVYSDGYSAANATKYEALDLTSGVVRSSQAHRDARYHMAVGILRPETHTVSMDIEALRCTRGDLVLLTHDVILVGLSYGRIKDIIVNAQGQVVGYVVDNECPMVAGKSYSIRLRHSDNTTSITSVINEAGFNSEVMLSAPIDNSVAGVAGDLFMFGETGKETAPCIVSKIGRGDDLSCDVTMVPYSAAIFTSDTSPIPPYDSLITQPILPSEAAPPAPLLALRSDNTVTNVGTDGTVYFVLVIDITPSSSGGVPVQQWEVQFQAADGTLWSPVGSTGLFPASTTSVSVPNVLVGSEYSVRGRSISADGNASEWTLVSNHTIVGKTTPPDQPTDATVTPIFAGNVISWINPGDADFSHMVLSASMSNDFSGSVEIANTSDVTFTHSGLTPGDTWYYWLASVNTSNIVASVLYVGSGTAFGVTQADTQLAQTIDDLKNQTGSDTTPPSVPTGLTSDGGVIAADGTIDLTFSWAANTESDLSSYILKVALNGGGAVPFPTASNTYVFHGLQPNTPFTAQVAAVDKFSNVSGYSNAYSGTTKKDTTPPNPPTSLSITPSVQGIFLSWLNDVAPDVVGARIYESTNPSFVAQAGGGGAIGTVNGIPGQISKLTRSGLVTGVTYYYFVSNLDSSGNESTPAGPISAAPLQVGTGDIAAYSITGQQIAGYTITGQNIMAGTVDANVLESGTSLPASLTIGTTGYSLGIAGSVISAGQAAGANRLSFSGFEAGSNSGGWVDPAYNPSGIGSDGGAFIYNGKKICKVGFTATAAYGSGADPNGYQQTSIEHTSSDVTLWAPVTPGETVWAGALIETSNARCTAYLVFADANGQNQVGSVIAPDEDVGFFPGSAGADWTPNRRGAFVAVPAGAVKAGLRFYFLAKDAGGGFGSIAEPMIVGAAPGQSIAPTYSAGPINGDPASVVNANTTLITPGKIQLSGANTLVNWIYGGDNTSINGGAIAANTIAANSATFGARNLTFSGFNFRFDGSNLVWDAGTVSYINDAGTGTEEYNVNGGSTSYAGSPMYIWTNRGNSSIYVGTSNNPGNPSDFQMGKWYGGTNINVTYGRTIINGDYIQTGTVQSYHIAAFAIQTTNLGAGVVTADKIGVTNLSAITGTIGTLRTASSGARTEISDNVIKVFDSNNALRVQIGDLTR